MLHTCKTIAAVAFSTSALWTSIRLGPLHFTHDAPDFLRSQILRANGAPLCVFVGTIMEEHGQTTEVSEVCRVLKEYNGPIREFQLTTRTAILAGSLVHAVFPILMSFPTLEVLFILSDQLAIRWMLSGRDWTWCWRTPLRCFQTCESSILIVFTTLCQCCPFLPPSPILMGSFSMDRPKTTFLPLGFSWPSSIARHSWNLCG